MEKLPGRNTTNISTKFVFIDTSAHFALVNRKDPDHQKAKQFLKSLAKKKVILVTTNFIVAETYTLILKRINRKTAINYISNLLKSSWVIRVSEEDEEKGWNILLNYEDKDFSYVDTTSFAVIERINIQEAFAFDEHFPQYGITRLPR
jgi:predicted nucleic acid-binding protein